MQKKTRSRLSEVIFIFICICCSLFSIYQFYQALNKTLVKDEEPVATISFKYKTAQRKFIDENLWDRLQQDSPVYEGDTIRTAEQSEATLNFADGNIMELQSNTMIRVSVSEEGNAEVEFNSGSINVRTTDESNMKIRSGSSVVEIAAGATVTAAGNGDDSGNLKVAVKEGNASFTGESGTIDLEAGKVTEISSSGTVEEHFLSVNYPEDNYRVMTFTKSKTPVSFGWESAGRNIILETSDSKSFDKITSTKTYKNVSSAQIDMAEGAHWWRMTTVPLSADEEPEVITGKVTVIYSAAPTPIAPRLGNSTTFRTKLPQIRLSWSESDRATAYRVDIANNSAMNNPVVSQRVTTTSLVVNTLAEGTWYWTVTPYYTMDDIGYANASAKSFFSITRSAELKVPVLQTPEADGIVCTQVVQADGTSNRKSVTFSWKNDAEADSYDLTIYREGSNSPFIQKTISANYCSINTAQDAIPNGSYSWQVTIRDEEGNTKTSDRQSFYAIDADIEQKTLSPPDNYRIVTSRTSEMSFTWKTNVPNPTTIEVAKDRNFRNIVLTASTTDTSVPGKQLAAGTYYWRISAKAGSTVLSTPVKTFEVEPFMKAPELESPSIGTELVQYPEVAHELSWKTVDDADYYQVRVSKQGSGSRYAIDQNFITSKDGKTASLPIDINSLEPGNYTWTVQAFRNETAIVSRSSSTVASYSFTVRQLRPVRLSGPAANSTIDGVKAWTEPSLLTWTTGDTPKSCTVKLYKVNKNSQSLLRTWTNAKSGIRLPQLEEGSYFWEIEATTQIADTEYDISPESGRSFTVSAIPGLALPVLAGPEDGTVFGVEYLQTNSSISFSWEPVPDATEYVLSISGSKQPMESYTFPADTSEWILEDLSGLDSGDFTWSLKAVRTLEGQNSTDKSKVIDGPAASSTFTIELPQLSIPKVKDFGRRYGM